ncbi:blue light receptor [Orbilia ellipsospora]|uniref:Blue light receptor n=1 Tax=Orbilia ellipsospora TaxID=2528407 RepID=A0AAV9XB21_9PEZI
MDQQNMNGRARQQQHQDISSSSGSPDGIKQKLQLRTNESLENQLAHLYHHHQQNNTHSPYIDFQNVLYSHGMGDNLATTSALLASMYSPVLPSNALPSDNRPHLNHNNMQSRTGHQQHRLGSTNGQSSIKSPIEAVSPTIPVKRQSDALHQREKVAASPLDCLAASPTGRQGISLGLAQISSKSHSSSQSEFQTQPAHQTPEQTQQGASQTQNNSKKRRDSVPSLPLHLDMDMQVDSGPLVSGAGGTGGSTLTEFTKRRNWSQRIIEELQDLLCILTPSGKIRYSSPNTKTITGYSTDELLGRMITDFVHTDDSHIFIREFNESIASSQQLNLYFRFRRKDDTYIVFETNGHPHFSDQRQMPSNTTTPVCSGFFIMARLYPTKNTALLDSFLEHKVENERLKRRIAELRHEEYEDQQAQLKARSEAANKESSRDETIRQNNINNINNIKAMPPPAMPGQLTRQNLEGLNNSAMRSDSLRDKMARYEGVTHADTIEMLTGLRYNEGERSRGISTGDTSPSLIRGDVGVPMSADRESRGSGERKKKIKVTNEYVCTDCGTLDSPEWRKGPTGPKTLCNACGLRWAKKEKKRNSVSGPSQPPPLGGPVPPMPSIQQQNNGMQ